MNLDDCGLPAIREKANGYVDREWSEIRDIEDRDRQHEASKAEAWARKAVATGVLPDRLDLLQRMGRDNEYRARRATASSMKKVIERRPAVRERVADWQDRDDFLSRL